MRIQIVCATPIRQRIETLDLRDGSTVGDALAIARKSGPLFDGQSSYAGLARFGKAVTEQDMLADGDRIELLRPLVADPKQSRRRRAEVQVRRSRSK